MSLPRSLSRALVFLLSTAFVLLGLEVAVRGVRPQRVLACPVNTWDSRIGTRQIPRARGFVSCPEYTIDLIINSEGLRDREFPYRKPAGTRRILCLGDSFTCGYGVQVESTYAKVLERILGARVGSPHAIEAINAGVGSTGTAQQLAYFVDEGHRYQPDVAVLAFFQGNDYWDNAISGLYTLETDQLVRRAAPRTGARRLQLITRWIPGWRVLSARSHLLSLVKFQVAEMHHRQLTERSEGAVEGADSEQRAEELTFRLLTEFRDACRARGCCPVVMLLACPAITPERPDKRARLAAHLAEQGIPCLDLEPPFSESGLAEQLHYPQDGHLTAAGHRLVARLLHDFLVERSLV